MNELKITGLKQAKKSEVTWDKTPGATKYHYTVYTPSGDVEGEGTTNDLVASLAPLTKKPGEYVLSVVATDDKRDGQPAKASFTMTKAGISSFSLMPTDESTSSSTAATAPEIGVGSAAAPITSPSEATRVMALEAELAQLRKRHETSSEQVRILTQRAVAAEEARRTLAERADAAEAQRVALLKSAAERGSQTTSTTQTTERTTVPENQTQTTERTETRTTAESGSRKLPLWFRSVTWFKKVRWYGWIVGILIALLAIVLCAFIWDFFKGTPVLTRNTGATFKPDPSAVTLVKTDGASNTVAVVKTDGPATTTIVVTNTPTNNVVGVINTNLVTGPQPFTGSITITSNVISGSGDFIGVQVINNNADVPRDPRIKYVAAFRPLEEKLAPPPPTKEEMEKDTSKAPATAPLTPQSDTRLYYSPSPSYSGVIVYDSYYDYSPRYPLGPAYYRPFGHGHGHHGHRYNHHHDRGHKHGHSHDRGGNHGNRGGKHGKH